MAYTALNRFTRPRTFLYLMTLRTGTELVTLTHLINKLTGVYGILALFTGYHLSSLQLSMYIYSILALILTTLLAPHIRKQSPLQCLALAWFYILDSIVNALYTVAFGVAWFLVLARHAAPFDEDGSTGGSGRTGPGSGMMGDTAGFNNPKYNVSRVDVVATPAPSATGSSSGGGVAVGLVGQGEGNVRAAAAASGAGGGLLGATILQSGSIASITVISALWAIRLYFILIVMAYARGVLRQSVVNSYSSVGGAAAATAKASEDNNNERGSEDASGGSEEKRGSTGLDEKTAARVAEAGYIENPFLGVEGYAGRLGRAMVAFPRSYWLGPEVGQQGQADLWREMGGRFNRRREGGEQGPVERERRHRAGTGPPLLKPIELGKVRK